METKRFDEFERLRPGWKQLIVDQGADYWRLAGAQGETAFRVYGWLLIPIYTLNFASRSDGPASIALALSAWMINAALNLWAFRRLAVVHTFIPMSKFAVYACAIIAAILGCGGLLFWAAFRTSAKSASKHIESAIRAHESELSPYPR